jgi:hypothetical protein
MLDLIFYSSQEPYYIEVSESFYEWLARSEFSKIGRSEPTKLEVEGEVVEAPLIKLGHDIREGLSRFFRDQIVSESVQILSQLDIDFSKELYQDLTYRLRKLQELRRCVEDQNYIYFQRA